MPINSDVKNLPRPPPTTSTSVPKAATPPASSTKPETQPSPTQGSAKPGADLPDRPPPTADASSAPDPLPDEYSPEVSNLPQVQIRVRGDAPIFERPVGDVIPDVMVFQLPDEVAERFAHDVVVLSDQLFDVPNLSQNQKLQRLYEVFLQYGERFVETVQSQPEAQHGQGGSQMGGKDAFKSDPKLLEALAKFLEILEEKDFGALKEQLTGKNGLQVARELLMSDSLQDFREQVKALVLLAPEAKTAAPDKGTAAPEQRKAAEKQSEQQQMVLGVPRDRAEDKLLPDRMKVPTWGPEAARVIVQPKTQADGRLDDPWERARNGMVLGKNMLWNVLHRMRGGPDESALNQDKWDRMTLMAIGALVFVGLVVIILVSL